MVHHIRHCYPLPVHILNFIYALSFVHEAKLSSKQYFSNKMSQTDFN